MGENLHVREKINEDRRLVILRLLVDYRGALNSSSIEGAVRAWGHKYIDRPMITDDLQWLEARGCVKLDELGAHVVEVCISPKGERAATGEEWITGIARPSGD